MTSYNYIITNYHWLVSDSSSRDLIHKYLQQIWDLRHLRRAYMSKLFWKFSSIFCLRFFFRDGFVCKYWKKKKKKKTFIISQLKFSIHKIISHNYQSKHDNFTTARDEERNKNKKKLPVVGVLNQICFYFLTIALYRNIMPLVQPCFSIEEFSCELVLVSIL